ncbi:uncharacterized protein LOC121726123 [Aricia agestis]|uniref:uncharacterized protein LOC121726123 n=1 Tax=Aricia agestis TaxID=91739 RepID=UPI001C20608F|nr:uncharacterized protein LOC121726123 [Aricia agestis]
MTRIVALIVLAQFLCVRSNLVSSTKKVVETSTVPNNGFSTDEIVEKTKIVFNTSDSNVYLEDVLYAIRSQEWSEDEMPCLNRTLVLLKNLQNFTLWSVWQWDSMSSQPLGLLYGSQYHLGNYDECLNTPWRESYPELQSKYCLADIVLQRTDRHVKRPRWNRNDPYQSTLQLIETKSVFGREIKKLTWGICVPAECQSQSVGKLATVLLAHTHLSMAGLSARIAVDDTCQDVYMDKRYDALFYTFIGLILFLMTIAIICTLFNDKTNEYEGVGSGVIKAFDIRSNLSSMMKSSDELHVLYGIKFMSMCVVVIGHQIGMFNSGPISNGVNMDEDSTSFLGLLFLHDDSVVDSFFMLSGFLTATAITKMKNLPNPLVMIFKRYMRLVIPYALMIFYVVAIFPYTGTGPLWNRAVAGETAQCKQNWWLNLLMVSNYVDTENVCIIISWYIPSDFHFFVFSLFLWELYRRSPALGKVLVGVITVVSVILPGVSTYMNDFPPIHAFNFEFISNPRGSKQFNELYIKSHMRYSAYVIGFVAGYVYVRPALIDHLKRLSQTWLTTIAYISTVSIFACMYLGSVLYWRDNAAVVNAMYAALNRPLWALGLAIIVLCCSVGHIPYIKAILSWYPWVPLSRLSYGVYLIHSMLITRNVFITRNLQFHDVVLLATSCAGIVFWSHLAALLMWLVAEAPINNLVTLMLKQGPKKTKRTAEHTEEKTQDNRAYLEDNLPPTIPTIQVISSKCSTVTSWKCNMTGIITLVVLIKILSAAANQVSSTKKIQANNDFSMDAVIEKPIAEFTTTQHKVYLENVIYTLKSQNWTDEEIPCLNRTLVLLRNLQNFTLWSVWEWDSMTSAPLGVLYGSQYHLGNYDECTNMPWRDTHPHLRSKYCLADIEMRRADGQRNTTWNKHDPYQSALQLIETKSMFGREIKKLTWGICVPAECQPQPVGKLVTMLLAHTHLSMAGLSARIAVDDTCQDDYQYKRYDVLFQGFMVIIVVLVTCGIVCTILNDRTNKQKGIGRGIMKAFDIRINMSRLMKSSGELHVLYGVRVLSMFVVVIGHQIALFNGGPVSNGIDVDKDSMSVLGNLILHDDVVVDSFYMLSGFLTAATITKMKNLPNPFIIIFKRWTRLVVPYALVIFWLVAVFPYTGTGPLWNRAVEAEAGSCRQNWWLNLLMVSNYVDPEHACIVVSWYIPSDFHFFVFSLFLWELYRRSPALGKVLLSAIFILSVILPGVYTYVKRYPPIHAFNIEFVANPRGGKQFNELYIKSHMRYSTYVIGFVAGYVYVRPALIDHLKRLSQTWLTAIAYASCVGIFACMYLGSVLYWHDNDAVVSAVYAALNRPLWALGLAIIVLCCSVGDVPFIKAILSWYPWVPLSRLSYGVYLIHSMLIIRNIFITRNLQHNDFFQLSTACAGIVFWSHLAALFMWVVAEAPINNLVTLMLKQGYKRSNGTKENTEEKPRPPRAHDNRAYLEDNLPPTIPTIQVISSKS